MPWRGIQVPYIHSNSAGKVTIDRGGYVKVGNICTITMRITVSTAIDASKWIFYGVPHHVFDINDSHGVMCERIKKVCYKLFVLFELHCITFFFLFIAAPNLFVVC